MLELNPKQIDIWCVQYEDIRDETLLLRYSALLSNEERQRQQRFYFAKDRHRFLLTRALVRSVLSRYATINAEDWIFSKNAFGMPLIDNRDSTAQKISFNISHTAGLIILAVGTERSLGIDTENTRIREAALDAAHRFFANSESAALAHLPFEMQHERFFQYWTLKESYIKARGMGLSIPLDKFSFDLETDASIAFSTSADLNDRASNWHFWQYRLLNDFTVSLCAQDHLSGAPNFAFRTLVPLKDGKPCLVQLVRQSS
jgi:4'-phosphopantetheinyl transferase